MRINKERKLHVYSVGDLVLWCSKTSKYSVGELESQWDGPYIVTEVNDNGTFEILDESRDQTQLVNGNKLKPYYVSAANPSDPLQTFPPMAESG